jgi:hypothetical protein
MLLDWYCKSDSHSANVGMCPPNTTVDCNGPLHANVRCRSTYMGSTISWSLQGALAALKQGTPGMDSERALEGVLTHSLARMDEAAVSMFLDVATILRGRPLELVMAVWTAWHSDAAVSLYQDLVWRSLLDSDAEGRLVMHDVLVALGRGVVLHRKPALKQHYGSRLWAQDGEVMGVEQVTPRVVVLGAALSACVWLC